MPVYKLMYGMADGDFQIDLDTGLRLSALDKKTALHEWNKLEKRCYSDKQLRIVYMRNAKPSFFLTGRKTADNLQDCRITKYQVCRPKGEHREINGIPVYTNDDYMNVSEKDFISLIEREYSAYFTQKETDCLDFEIISIFVVPTAPERN